MFSYLTPWDPTPHPPLTNITHWHHSLSSPSHEFRPVGQDYILILQEHVRLCLHIQSISDTSSGSRSSSISIHHICKADTLDSPGLLIRANCYEALQASSLLACMRLFHHFHCLQTLLSAPTPPLSSTFHKSLLKEGLKDSKSLDSLPAAMLSQHTTKTRRGNAYF